MSESLFVVWPDGFVVPKEDFDYERNYAWRSDDYAIVPWSELTADQKEEMYEYE